MPSTIIVNFLTTQHKLSMGVTTAFPDVCKTPAPPAPSPIPIPYPNIGNSAMASIKVTKRVGDDKNQKVMLKSSAYSLTSGDEPGVALGIISNKIKGKSTSKNASFNVKFEGKGVSRLSDPHGNNGGCSDNAFSPAEMQGPLVGIDASKLGKDQAEACELIDKNNKVPRKKPKKPGSHEEAAEMGGIRPDDYKAMQKVCEQRKVSVSFRDTNPECLKHMDKGVGSKGHDVLTKTFEKDKLPDGEKDLAGMVSVLDKKPEGSLFKDGKLTPEAAGCITKGKDGKPVVDPDSVTSAKDLLYKDKNGKPLTGDYDMGDMFDKNGKRIRGGPKERSMQNWFNAAIGKPDRVKHGAQSNFYDFVRSPEGKKEMAAMKKANKKFPAGLMQAGIDPKKGEGLTVFDGSKGKPAKVYRLDTHEDVVNYYRCKGEPLPEMWNYRDKKTGTKIKG